MKLNLQHYALFIYPMLERRQFLKVSALTTLFTIAPNFFFPLSADAEVQSNIQDNQQEKYHIFIGEEIIRNGGKQKVTLKSGESHELDFKPGEVLNAQTIVKPDWGLQGNEVCFVIHVLSSEANNTVSDIIKKSQLQFPNIKELCEDVYQKIQSAEFAEDLAALDLLDYLVTTSGASDEIRSSYELASQNSRLIAIESSLEDALKKSQLDDSEKKSIRGTYQFVRAGEPINDFGALTQLDKIVETASIPTSLKRKYSIASATSRALTTDILIIALLNKEPPKLINAYKLIRDGHKNSEDKVLYELLDYKIRNSDLPNDAKVIYQVAREMYVNTDKVAEAVNFKDVAQQVTNIGAKIIPSATNVLGLLGGQAGTGAAISSLSGGAALNSTLAFLGGGSVASGGLGMLGGLAVVTSTLR